MMLIGWGPDGSIPIASANSGWFWFFIGLLILGTFIRSLLFFDIVDRCLLRTVRFRGFWDGWEREFWHIASCFAVGVTECSVCILRMDDSLSSEVRASGGCLGA